MKLQERLPQGVSVNGRFYRLDFDFRNVLRMMEILRRNDLMPEAREYLALRCLTKKPKNAHAVMGAVRSLLFDQKPSGDQQKVTDFDQDAGLIRAAFRQEYGIDLYRDKLHWMEFSDLLSGLPGGNRYSEVIGIRARPMPKATKWNAEERQWLAKAKSQVALQVSEEERQERYDKDVMNIFAGLMAIAKRGEKPDV